MNRIIFAGLVLVAIALSSCSTTSKYMTSGSLGLKGNVESITDMYYIAYQSVDFGDNWQKAELATGESNTHQKRYFSEKGKHLKQEFLTHEREVRAVYLTVWDEKGETVLHDKYSRDGKVIYIGEHSYPSKDSVIVNTHRENDDTVIMNFNSKIDKKGREFFCTYYRLNKEGEIIDSTDISTEYEKDREIEFRYETDGRTVYHFTYHYLEFDKHGNWTKARRKDQNSGNDYIIEREIEYYN